MSENDAIEGDRIIVRIPSKLDVVAAKPFEARLLTHLGSTQRLILLDFTNCNYISSAGLRLVLIAAKRSKAAGKQLILAGMNKIVRDVFRVSGFDKMLVVETDLESALAKHN